MPIFLPESLNQDHDTPDKDVLADKKFLQDTLLTQWGKPLHQWKAYNEMQKDITVTNTRHAIPDLSQKKYSFSNQKAAFNTFITHLIAILPMRKGIFEGELSWHQFHRERLGIAKLFFQEGSTFGQRIFLAFTILLFEIVMPLLWLTLFISAVIMRVLLETGLRFPLLWLFYFTVSGSGINGTEALPPAEDGYTKVFHGCQHVDLDELEEHLMERNDESSPNDPNANVHTICISYKHFANKGKIPGDDHRICRTDLQAIAQLIKAASPCKLRLWIDTKLPESNDPTFERWINRGVRPYGRYITFLCPSAQQYAQSSFWLSNEYHFASAAKGAMYYQGNEIIYDLRYGYKFDLYKRFFQILIEAERHPVQVRDEDKAKVIHWAMCCLRAEDRGTMSSLSPNIDNMTMTGKRSHDMGLMDKIAVVIRKYGPQELPISPGRSWNKQNPLLLAGLPEQKFDLPTWFGMSLDECPETVYFIYVRSFTELLWFETVLVLEVMLERPHFCPGKIRVVRKVLIELSRSVLLRCKFVTVPWLCDWE